MHLFIELLKKGNQNMYILDIYKTNTFYCPYYNFIFMHVYRCLICRTFWLLKIWALQKGYPGRGRLVSPEATASPCFMHREKCLCPLIDRINLVTSHFSLKWFNMQRISSCFLWTSTTPGIYFTSFYDNLGKPTFSFSLL